MYAERLFDAIDNIVEKVGLEALKGVSITAQLPREAYEAIQSELMVDTVAAVFGDLEFTVARSGVEVNVKPVDNLLIPQLTFTPEGQ